MHPAGHLVRRKSHNGGLYRVSRTQPFIVILHRNLAFFQTLCEAVPEYIGRRIEAVITGLTRNHTLREVPRNKIKYADVLKRS